MCSILVPAWLQAKQGQCCQPVAWCAAGIGDTNRCPAAVLVQLGFSAVFYQALSIAIARCGLRSTVVLSQEANGSCRGVGAAALAGAANHQQEHVCLVMCATDLLMGGRQSAAAGLIWVCWDALFIFMLAAHNPPASACCRACVRPSIHQSCCVSEASSTGVHAALHHVCCSPVPSSSPAAISWQS